MARESAEDKLVRMTIFERELWDGGVNMVAGIDEVGRGPLAGPVVSACVIIARDKLVLGVDDSKKLTGKKRDQLYDQLMERAIHARCASAGSGVIDEINILQATRRTMQEAAAGANGAYFLVDAVTGLALPGEARSIIKGDANSYMIAAASIIAKVTRDRYMIELHERYPEYNFLSNKGYGTPEHMAAIVKYGPCPEHRRSFIRRILR